MIPKSSPDPWTIHLLQDKLRRDESLSMPEQRWLAFEVARVALEATKGQS